MGLWEHVMWAKVGQGPSATCSTAQFVLWRTFDIENKRKRIDCVVRAHVTHRCMRGALHA